MQGYVHGAWGETSPLTLIDSLIRCFIFLRVPHRIGLNGEGELTVTSEYMPLKIVASFMSTGDMEGGVPANVMAARPGVLDPDIDFCAFGVMMLKH